MRYFVIFLLLFSSLHADDKPKSEMVILPAGTVVEGDYFAFGNSVEISGKVTGDVYVCAGQLFVDGEVGGDILGICASAQIAGHVDGNIRAVCGQIIFSGTVGHNVSLATASAELTSLARIGGNLVSVTGNIDLNTPIGGEATIVASSLRSTSFIGKSLRAWVSQMRITSKAHIVGDVDYQSNNLASIDPQAIIGGTVTHHPSFVHQVLHGGWVQKILIGSKVVTALMNFLYTLAVGWILLRFFPKNLEGSVVILQKKPLKALVYGLLLLILLPLASLILLMTILGVPFALTLIALNVIGFFTAKIISILWGSNMLFGKLGLKPNKIGTFAAGLVVYFLLTSIPYAGLLIAFAAMLFGLGASVLVRLKSV